MSKNSKRLYYVFILLTVTTLLISAAYIFRMYVSSRSIATSNSLDHNWTCSVSSGTYYSLTLPASFQNDPDNAMVLTHVLPDEISKGSALLFRSSQQAVKVYIGDDLAYEYHSPGSRLTGIATPSKWNFIPVETMDASKEVRVELTSPYPSFSGKVKYIYYGDFVDLTSNLLNHTLHGYICSLLILTFGMIILFTSQIFYIQNPDIRKLQYLGCFNILLALWIRSEVQLPDYLSFNPHFELVMGLYCMMLCPIPFLLYIKDHLFGKIYQLTKYFLGLYLVNFVVCILLQLFGIRDLVETSNLFPLLLIPMIIMICIQYILQLIHRQKYYPIFSIFAFVSLVISIVMELLFYYVGHNEYFNHIFHTIMIIYILCLTFSAVQSIVSNEMLSAQASEQILVRQIKMMLSHIQPHFLFNSLGAIQAFVKKSPDTAYQMLFDFSKYLRASINAWSNQSPIPFSSEIENVKAFTNIQLIRFSNNFHVEFELDATDFKVPLLSIRALVENAVNHGARKSTSELPFVHIHSYETSDFFIIEVIDNGPGFDVIDELDSSDSTSGLHRCKHSLETQMNAILDIHSTMGKGTTIIVRIPKNAPALLVNATTGCADDSKDMQTFQKERGK